MIESMADLLSQDEIKEIRERVLRAIAPLKPAERGRKYVFGDIRTDGGRELPPYYLVYFLLVELLAWGRTSRSPGSVYRGRRWKRGWWSLAS